MRRLMVGALLLLVVAGASSLPVAVVHASTVQGTAVTISGLDDLNATVDSQARKGAGKIVALILGAAGLGGIVSGYHLTGMMGVGSGIAMGFLPMRLISSPHVGDDLAADPLAAGLVTGHDPGGGRDDRRAHAALDTRHL